MLNLLLISMQREPIEIPDPISIPGEDKAVKKFLDDLVEDIEIPDVEFSVGKPENDDNTMEFKTEDVPENQANKQETAEINPIEDDDQLMDIPNIAGAPERKIKALRRVSMGSNAAGEMDLYLQGYGEDYGSRSSTTDLEQEGLRYYKEREIKKSLAARDKEKEKQSKENSPTKDEERAPVSFKQKSKKLLNFSKFTRKNKKTSQVADQSADTQPQEFTTPAKPKPVATVLPQIMVEAVHINGERDSIAVNTSLGGTDSDDTIVDEPAAGKGHVHLPLESVSVSDRVRRLQQSVKEHHPDDIITEVSIFFFSTRCAQDYVNTHTVISGFKSLSINTGTVIYGTFFKFSWQIFYNQMTIANKLPLLCCRLIGEKDSFQEYSLKGKTLQKQVRS